MKTVKNIEQVIELVKQNGARVYDNVSFVDRSGNWVCDLYINQFNQVVLRTPKGFLDIQ